MGLPCCLCESFAPDATCLQTEQQRRWRRNLLTREIHVRAQKLLAAELVAQSSLQNTLFVEPHGFAIVPSPPPSHQGW